MTRVFATGDMHGPHGVGRLAPRNFPLGQSLTRDDCVVVLGDFGLLWDGSEQEGELLDMLDALPRRTWHGGEVGVVREHVLHLRRGELFGIGGRSFFALGGARSTDQALREPGISWWPEEIPSAEGLRSARATLEGAGMRVDYVLTHCASRNAQFALTGVQALYPLNEWLQTEVEGRCAYRGWLFGHYHVDRLHIGGSSDMPYTCERHALFNAMVEVVVSEDGDEVVELGPPGYLAG